MILVDGTPAATVSVADRGLHYGDGLFETMRLHGGRVPLLERHLARLEAGCLRLGLPRPDRGAIDADIRRAGAKGGDGVVKVILTRGDGARGYAPPAEASVRRIVAVHPLAPPAPGPVTVGLCRTPLGRNPALAGLKHLARLEQVLGAREVAGAGWFDGLMLDDAGAVVEATRHNLFLVEGARLVTPALTHSGVAGVMRDLVLEAAAGAGIDARVGRVEPADLDSADEAFLSNAVAGLVPVSELAGRPLPGGAVAGALRSALVRLGVTWLAG